MAALQKEEPDFYDRLARALAHYPEYPLNVLRSTLSIDTLKEYLGYLDKNDVILFNAAEARLVFWDQWGGTQSLLHPAVCPWNDIAER